MGKDKLTYWEKKRARILVDVQPPDRARRYAKQFDKIGWCEADIWSLDVTMAKWFAPKLRRLIETKFGPIENYKFDTEEEKKSYAKYISDYNVMLEGFELLADDDNFMLRNFVHKTNTKEQKRKHRVMQKALKLFPKLYFSMWN
jgi:hypothetical protein